MKHRRKDKKTAESKLVAAAKDIWRETDKKVSWFNTEILKQK